LLPKGHHPITISNKLSLLLLWGFILEKEKKKMANKKKYEDLVNQIADLLGGIENINFFTHCVTRLRFTIKDRGLVKDEDIEKIQGVVGINWAAEQLQIIIGQNVSDVYNMICDKTGLNMENPVDENLDDVDENKKFSLKGLGNAVLGYISPVMFGILPVMIGAAMCKTIAVIIGPGVLNIVDESNDLYLLFIMLYNTFFYFLPVYLAYLASKQLKTNVLLGMFMGLMIITPDLVNMVGVRETFSVYGFSVPVANYSQTFLPVIVGIWIMSYVYRYLNKYIPTVIAPILVPTLTILIMTPIMLGVCAPLGTYLGNILGNIFISLVTANVVIRILAYIGLGILFPYIILGGMHMVLINFAILTFLENGFEAFVLPVSIGYSFAVYGLALGAFLKFRQKENKATALSCLASGLLAGISEPILYGIVLKYKNAMKALIIPCAIGGLYCGILLPKVYVAGSLVNIFSTVPMWIGGSNANVITGVVLMILTFIVSAVSSYLLIDYRTD